MIRPSVTNIYTILIDIEYLISLRNITASEPYTALSVILVFNKHTGRRNYKPLENYFDLRTP